MRRHIPHVTAPVLLLLAAFASSSGALLVVPSSRCAVQCGNVLSSTNGPELTCSDRNYSSTVVGQTFQNCVTCELNSTHTDSITKQRDLKWLLYNLRYTVSWCLWGFPNNTNVAGNPCLTSFACGDLRSAVEYDLLTPRNTTEFGYCSLWSNENVDECTTCIRQLGDRNYLANFVTTLTAGCEQRPPPDSRISIDGSPFQSTLINITTPNASPLPTLNSSSSGSNLSLEMRVGIAIGAILLLLLLSGIFIVWRGKRRRRAHLAKLARASYRPPAPAWAPSGKEFSNSPQSETYHHERFVQSPQSPEDHDRDWQDSPRSADGGVQSFSPYASPVSPAVADGERIFAPVPIPRAYGGREGIEMSPVSVKPPIIKAPVPGGRTTGKDEAQDEDEEVARPESRSRPGMAL